MPIKHKRDAAIEMIIKTRLGLVLENQEYQRRSEKVKKGNQQ